MKMLITNIEYENNDIFITCKTTIGNLKGKWCDKLQLPILLENYHCELIIREIERTEVAIFTSGEPSVCYENGMVAFTGVCEEIDDIYVVRFAGDWLEMVDVKNDDFMIKRGDVISFAIEYEGISIYPYEL
ncbi:MAG: hypothetical protein IKK33_08385 [Lachnospiraceae bacterium]|nr:hypothetical protein [Lachnospiraceae bacterium]